MDTQQRSAWLAQRPSRERELELVELVEEVDQWKATSEELIREVEALRRERERLVSELRIANDWRRGLAEELGDYARADPWRSTKEPVNQGHYEQDGGPFRGLLVGIPLGVLLWAMLVLIGYAAYQLWPS